MAFAFDTLGYANKLKEGGIPSDQAEIHAEAARDFIMAELVTRNDLMTETGALRRDLTTETGALRREMETLRRDLEKSLEVQIKSLELRLTIRLGVVALAIVSVLAAIIKF
jgi:hypothetical protein